MTKTDDVGPWGKVGDVEVITAETQPQMQAETINDGFQNFASPFAWFKYSFKLKGILNRKEYLQLIFVPAFTFLMGNIWLQLKLVPAIIDKPVNNLKEAFIASQLYMEALPNNQKMLVFIVSLLLLFCLWSLMISTIKRLKDCGLNNIASLLVAVLGIVFLWPVMVIIASFIPSNIEKKQDSYDPKN